MLERDGQSKEIRLVSLTPTPEILITALYVGSMKTVSLEIHEDPCVSDYRVWILFRKPKRQV